MAHTKAKLPTCPLIVSLQDKQRTFRACNKLNLRFLGEDI
ncbi:unnamed protein product [Paramecium octaurelia]|uniref:Uncharacterized protein n=1 Tax=Paramecium octaurelia TaxID=43137 RepID=A0A8S1YNL8_PAROT|nr:unnamed protein product [Paramecium octaurelia]CAD8215121.1 unnamed protein product [Paramecium octaurelia]